VTASGGKPIQLHTDFLVDLAREDEFLRAFQNEFLPNIRQSPGFIDAKLLKLRQANVGDQPTALNYRLAQTFESEETRVAWTEAPGHALAWPPLEKPLKMPEGTKWLFTALLFDTI
jgi:heme-degrading monooxygenase HmoA